MAMTQSKRHNGRSLCRALALREATGAQRWLDAMPRRAFSAADVLKREDCSVLLGFSSDGWHLVYYSWWEQCCEVQWKTFRVDESAPVAALLLDREPVFRLVIGPTETAADADLAMALADVGSGLRLLQSLDDELVVAIMTERSIASQEMSQVFHLVITPSPHFQARMDCDCVSFLRCQISVPFASPEPAPATLTEPFVPGVHGLVLVTGASVTVAFLSTRQTRVTTQFMTSINFSKYYSSPEFPIVFQQCAIKRREATHKPCPLTVKVRWADECEKRISADNPCKCEQQRVLDVECFLRGFLDKYASLRHFNLVDYDVRLVMVSSTERTAYMSCVMKLEPNRSQSLFIPARPQQQQHAAPCMAMLFSLDLVSGATVIIQALQMPKPQTLRQLATTVTLKYLRDLTHRVPLRMPSVVLSNAAVLKGKSLRALQNPRFPLSIYLP
ncbi:TPA: hypothetical protein N0F65_000011 [Lagenidium giganteum]|uniref:Uncharacterized protein n=1 Tax=Lagenidium giganteum TaxID=4803 RepID=A0AAV2YKP3_9STRA|nr:TPA: hypothetical protein N0F65_000011 [Lagenidium giganteum]